MLLHLTPTENTVFLSNILSSIFVGCFVAVITALVSYLFHKNSIKELTNRVELVKDQFILFRQQHQIEYAEYKKRELDSIIHLFNFFIEWSKDLDFRLKMLPKSLSEYMKVEEELAEFHRTNWMLSEKKISQAEIFLDPSDVQNYRDLRALIDIMLHSFANSHYKNVQRDKFLEMMDRRNIPEQKITEDHIKRLKIEIDEHNATYTQYETEFRKLLIEHTKDLKNRILPKKS